METIFMMSIGEGCLSWNLYGSPRVSHNICRGWIHWEVESTDRQKL